MSRIEVDYRLGNILDAWYGQAHVAVRNACNFTSMTRENTGTFGKFLVDFPPTHLVPDPSRLFLEDAANWWWTYDYDNHVSVYPYFTDSLRAALAAYFGDGVPVEANTCVIHYRVGDFLKEKTTLSVECLVAAIDKFENTPTRFEILNGGAKFRATPELEQMSHDVLSTLKVLLQEKYPSASIILIESDNADADFMRMVNAPMLLTGPGSFAVMAAAANRNERLTPAIKNINFPCSGPIPSARIYEKWSTYA